MALYTEAAAHILAEEEAADAVLVPTVGELVADRFQDLAANPARFTAYLDGLELTHGADPAMAAYIARARVQLAGLAGGSADTTPHASWLDRSPQVAEATEGAPQ
jgi:hypothetical protein